MDGVLLYHLHQISSSNKKQHLPATAAAAPS
jgi:hypothetical protein